VTSLVAVLNNQAVALAADSAVTTQGPFGQKIYNTVNKLFTLSKYHPVGIMVYSSAEIMGVPIETAIKVYRERLGTRSFDRLEEYYEDFILFLKIEPLLFTEEARIEQCATVIGGCLYNLRDQILRHLDTKYIGWGQPTPAQVKQTAQAFLNDQVSQFQASAELPDANPNVRIALKNKLKPRVNQWKAQFKQDFLLSNACVALLTDHCLDMILRYQPTGIETGFVIAGFGEKEYLPQLRSFEFESSVFGVHKMRAKQSADVSAQGATIVPFAQREMVDTFMRGRTHQLDNLVMNLIDGFFYGRSQEIAADPSLYAQSAEIVSFLEGMRKDLREHVREQLKEFTTQNHVGPIIETVNAMPKEELALTAEALVNLTAIKRRASADAETVGGPTDVAVISKGDGFIWIKRKHYFRSEINPHFGQNYFR